MTALLTPQQLQFLNLATNRGQVKLTQAMTERFNEAFCTDCSLIMLNVFWHHTPGGPDQSRLQVTKLSPEQVKYLNERAIRKPKAIDKWMLDMFNMQFKKAYTMKELPGLYALSLGTGLLDFAPSTIQGQRPSLRH